LTALKYAPPLLGLVLVTVLVAIAEWKGGHWLLGTAIPAVGGLIGLLVVGMGTREFRHPLLTVTFVPEDETATAQHESDAPPEGTT
jgi:hypothetical protein